MGKHIGICHYCKHLILGDEKYKLKIIDGHAQRYHNDYGIDCYADERKAKETERNMIRSDRDLDGDLTDVDFVVERGRN